MILVYPTGWATNDPPFYLVTGDRAFFIEDGMTGHNLQRVGVPLVPWPIADIDFILEKLAPGVEHPLA